MSRRKMFALSIAALSLYASGALAQLGRRARGSGDGREKGGAQEPVNQIEVTLHEFHEDLKLNGEQEAAWEAYVERIRALMSDIAIALAGNVARTGADRGAPPGK